MLKTLDLLYFLLTVIHMAIINQRKHHLSFFLRSSGNTNENRPSELRQPFFIEVWQTLTTLRRSRRAQD